MGKKWKLLLISSIAIVLITTGLWSYLHWFKNIKMANTPINVEENVDNAAANLQNDAILTVPKTIKEEDSRFVDSKHILHINILNSQTKSGAQKRLLQGLFPDASIQYIDSGDVFDAFNLVYKGEKYNAVFSFDQQDDVSFLDVIFITRGEFNINNLESLFN